MTTILLLDLKQVCAATSLSKTVIYELIRAGDFPRPIHIPHTRRVAWRAEAVSAAVATWEEQSNIASNRPRQQPKAANRIQAGAQSRSVSLNCAGGRK